MRYLLLISCSQRKVETSEPLPAIDLYDGPVYRPLRKMGREGRFPENVDVSIISANHGLIPLGLPIETYDQKMAPERAAELASVVQADLKRAIISNADDFGTHAYIYDQVFINLGKVYMRTLEGFHWRFISTMEASGGIGQRTSQMKVWLERIHKESGGN